MNIELELYKIHPTKFFLLTVRTLDFLLLTVGAGTDHHAILSPTVTSRWLSWLNRASVTHD